MIGTIIIIAALVAFIIWVIVYGDRARDRCPDCGRRVTRVPHNPKCVYWRDR